MMKPVIYLFALLIVFNTQLKAQISQGGTPAALKMNLKKNIDAKFLKPVSQDWKDLTQSQSEKNGTLDIIAKHLETGYTLQNSGTWTSLKNGDRVWRLVITAEAALAVNPLIKDFYLPKGAKLFVYNQDASQVLGAFTEKNNNESGYFSTELIYGNTMILEYYEPRNVKNEGTINIEKVASFFKNVYTNRTKDFGDSQFCEVNINCAEGNNWQDEKRGVARILVTGAGGSGWCTGSLLNNTSQNTPYFLTAYHCGDNTSTSQFNQWIFYFNYEFSGCNNSSIEPNTSNTITGAQVVARSNDLNSSSISSDFLLLELNSAVPSSYNVYYNGWDISSTTPTPGVGIHHPAGDVKKISTFNSNVNSVGVVWSNGGGGYSTSPSGTTHWSVQWAATTNGHGVTEGGSSGSPIFNSNGLIVGTLSGGSSQCSSTSSRDQYGKMSYHWNSNNASNTALQLKPWLDPNNSGISSLEGSETPGNNGGGSGTPLVDAKLDEFVSPSSSNCSFQITPSVRLSNQGLSNLVSAQISYQLNSGSAINQNWTGNLATGQSIVVSLPNNTTAQLSNIISASVSNPNNTTDGNTSNNDISLNFEAGVSNDLPFLERFEENPSTNPLRILNPDNDTTWALFGSGSYNTSSRSAFMDNWDYTNGVDQFDWIVTEAYDFSDTSISEELYFDYAYTYYRQNNGTNVSYDSLGIAVSLDCGENFFWIWKEGGEMLATVPGGLGEEFFPNSNQWDRQTVDLSSLKGESSVVFAFISISGYGNNLFLDNIGIGKVLLGIEDETNRLENQISLYPNPTNDYINLSFNIDKEEKLNISIFNILGQEVYSNEITSRKNNIEHISVSDFEKGIYYVKVKNTNHQELLQFIKK